MRALLWFWIAVAVTTAVGAGTLQYLGPPDHPAPKQVFAPAPVPAAAGQPPAPNQPAAASNAPATPASQTVTARTASPLSGAAANPGEAAPPVIPIHAPDAALMEVATNNAPAMLPRIGPDGRKPMQVYAAAFTRVDRRPRIAILLGGIGQSEADSEEAVSLLPPEISFVVSPYAPRSEKLLDDIRARGHEMLIGVPMEPANNPVNSEGSHQLMTGVPPDQNARNLEWALSRIQGYVGATNALDGLRGERFAASSQQMLPVLQEIANRGLLYVDAAPASNRLPVTGVSNLVTGGIDLVIDQPAVRSEIDMRLTQLEQMADERGAAIGLVGLPHPVTRSRLATWADGLAGRGLVLAPVSAIVRYPAVTPASPISPATSAPFPPRR